VELSAASMSEQGKGKLGRAGSVMRVRGICYAPGVGDATRRQGENGARHPGSCAGATETGAGRAVFGVVRKQGVGGARGLHMRAWAGLGEGRSWAGPESNSANFDLK
jgi:hypothetical protein